MIRAVLFGLGDTLIVEEAVSGRHLWKVELGETIEELLLLKTVGRKNNNCNQSKGLLTHEQALKILAGAPLQDMARVLNCKPDAIRIELSRLGLKVVVALLGFLLLLLSLCQAAFLTHEKVLPSNFVRGGF